MGGRHIEISIVKAYGKQILNKIQYCTITSEEPTGGRVITHGSIPYHRISENLQVVCTNRLMKDTGISCPLCSLMYEPIKYCNAVLYIINNKLVIYRPNSGKKYKVSDIITTLASSANKHYKCPYNIVVYDAFDQFPSYLAPRLYNDYNSWFKYVDSVYNDLIGEYTNESNSSGLGNDLGCPQ